MHTHEPSHLATPSTLPRTLRVATTDGLSLAVYVHGDHAHGAHGAHDKPCVLLVHGYPDTSEVYDGMVAALSPRYRVVTYDSRGAGASDKPQLKAAYLLPQLLADMHAVIDAVSPKRPVHLVGHDWGSIQSWHAVTDPSLQRRVASFTSISGPSLDYAGAWMRKRARGVLHDPRGFARLLAQLARSSYIAAFVTPGLGEWVWHSGLADRLVGKHGPTGTL
ncbi:MAG: alpha/beta fold hydrolase [Polyangiales bacterium]